MTATAGGVESPIREGRVICGDALDILGSFPSESFDAVVTDPPFGVGFRYGKIVEQQNDAESYWAWFEPRYREMERVLRPGGFMAVYQCQRYYPHFWEWFGMDIRVFIAAKNFVSVVSNRQMHYAYDPVITYYKRGADPLANPDATRRMDWSVGDTASHRGRVKWHPCPKPPVQLAGMIDSFTKVGGMVLDPFTGSGAIGVAARMVGRRFVGVEIQPEYTERAQERINGTEKNTQGSLWSDGDEAGEEDR